MFVKQNLFFYDKYFIQESVFFFLCIYNFCLRYEIPTENNNEEKNKNRNKILQNYRNTLKRY